MKKLCKNCIYWGDERLKLHGKLSENYRICNVMSHEGYKTFTEGSSPCDAWIEGFTEKNDEKTR